MPTKALNEKEIFNVACEIESNEARSVYLHQVCGSNAELLDRVAVLLRMRAEQPDFLESDPPKIAATIDIPQRSDAPADHVGPYKLVEKIGEGGMGLVYMAEQKEPVRRSVALKVIKPGMDSQQVVARFESERQVLALMNHPNIAKVFDAGTTDSGLPYFVMELVKGIPITEFCDQQRLDTRERLELFSWVCSEVQHAHQKGVIHRDLKPSNVLVELHDVTPVTKVIDFGVAKATNRQLTERTLHTGYAQMIGTPLYMSPEQAQLNGLDVDTRSDIYSLGVLLYELLTGTTPFDRETLRSAGFDEMRRIIREEDPRRPSDRVSTLAAEAISTISERRKVDERTLVNTIRGELDWIVMKALEKDRTHRYETAAALIDDIARYLDGRSVQAVPPSTAYRLKKFAARHKTMLTTASLIVFALVGGIATSLWYAQEARREADAAQQARQLADQHAKQSDALVDFLIDGIMEAASPAMARGEDPTIREFLSTAESNIDASFAEQPKLHAWVRHQLAQAYHSLGAYDLAERNILESHRIRVELLGKEHSESLDTADTMALVYSRTGKTSEAIALAQETLETRQRLHGRTHFKTRAATNTLGRALLEANQLDKASDVFRSLLDVSLEVGADETAVWAYNNLGVVYKQQGNVVQARKYLRAAIDGFTQQKGADHPETLDATHNLAGLLTRAGEFDEAKQLYTQLLSQRRKVQGDNHPDTQKTLSSIAHLHFELGELTLGELLEELLEQYRRRFGDHPRTAGVLNSLSLIDQNENKPEDALSKASEAHSIFELHLGGEAPNTLIALNNVANAHKALEQRDEAISCYDEIISKRQAIGTRQPKDFSNLTNLGGAHCNLANLLLARKQYALASQRYEQAIKVLESVVEASSLNRAKLFLGFTNVGYADALRQLGRHSESLAANGRACSLLNSAHHQFVLGLSKCATLAADGQDELAIDQLESLLEDHTADAEQWYEAARVYAIAFHVKADDEPASKRQPRSGHYAARALDLLKKVRDEGHFRDAKNIASLQRDDDFMALRESEEYETFSHSLSD